MAEDVTGHSNVIAVNFAQDSSAYEALTRLKELDSQNQIKLEGAAVVARGQDGQLAVMDEIHDGYFAGTAGGGLVGLLIGIPGGPLGMLEGYGLSETSPVAAFSRRDRERKPGSIGLPVRGVEMRLTDVHDGVGEVTIRGHNVMKGYWNNPGATADAIDPDGWFHTGDLARVDEDGYFFIVDRKKEMIIRGGFNIYPREIEEVLHEHPDVMEAAVVGLPHDELGEDVGAAVVLKPGHQVDAEEIKNFVKARVAAYKYPRLVWFEESLPKGPTGKILRREIKHPSNVT